MRESSPYVTESKFAFRGSTNDPFKFAHINTCRFSMAPTLDSMNRSLARAFHSRRRSMDYFYPARPLVYIKKVRRTFNEFSSTRINILITMHKQSSRDSLWSLNSFDIARPIKVSSSRENRPINRCRTWHNCPT